MGKSAFIAHCHHFQTVATIHLTYDFDIYKHSLIEKFEGHSKRGPNRLETA